MEFLQHILDWFTNLSTGGMIGTIAMIVEFLLRMIKTPKPLSLLYVVRDGMDIIAKIFGKVVELLDRILPQRTKQPSE